MFINTLVYICVSVSLYFNEGKIIKPLKFITVSYLDILSHN